MIHTINIPQLLDNEEIVDFISNKTLLNYFDSSFIVCNPEDGKRKLSVGYNLKDEIMQFVKDGLPVMKKRKQLVPTLNYPLMRPVEKKVYHKLLFSFLSFYNRPFRDIFVQVKNEHFLRSVYFSKAVHFTYDEGILSLNTDEMFEETRITVYAPKRAKQNISDFFNRYTTFNKKNQITSFSFPVEKFHGGIIQY